MSFCVALGFGIVGPAIPIFANEFGVTVFWASAVVSVFAFMRLVGYMVSGFILYIGFLMIAFNPDKMALHDKIAKTRVLKIR